jgi:surfactin synthase thioesterase subunit
VVLTAEHLTRVACPVQLIWGEDDTFGSPELGRQAAEILPRTELHVIPGGHVPWVNNAESVARIAAPFLREHLARDRKQVQGDGHHLRAPTSGDPGESNAGLRDGA